MKRWHGPRKKPILTTLHLRLGYKVTVTVGGSTEILRIGEFVLALSRRLFDSISLTMRPWVEVYALLSAF